MTPMTTLMVATPASSLWRRVSAVTKVLSAGSSSCVSAAAPGLVSFLSSPSATRDPNGKRPASAAVQTPVPMTTPTMSTSIRSTTSRRSSARLVDSVSSVLAVVLVMHFLSPAQSLQAVHGKPSISRKTVVLYPDVNVSTTFLLPATVPTHSVKVSPVYGAISK